MPVARLRGRQSLRRIFRFGFCEGLLYFFGGGAGLARDADGHVCGKFLGKIHEFARATLPHLRKTQQTASRISSRCCLAFARPCSVRFTCTMRRSLGSTSRSIRPFFSNAANSVEILPDVTFNAVANCEGVCAPLNSSSRIMNGSPLEAHATSPAASETSYPQTTFISLSNDSRSKPTLHLALFDAHQLCLDNIFYCKHFFDRNVQVQENAQKRKR